MHQIFSPEKPIALIAGVIKGVGQEVARLLSEGNGMTLVVGSRDEAVGREVTENLVARGGDAHFVHLDVTDSASIAAATRWLGGAFGGRLDVLVNNASVILAPSLPDAQGMATFKDVFDANVRGPLMISKAVLPFLRRSPAGRIVNVSSGLGLLAPRIDPDWELSPYRVLCYNCSKAALRMQTVLFAKEIGREGGRVKVNVIDCGGTATDRVEGGVDEVIERCARAVVRLATLPPDGPSGGVFSEGQPLP